MSPGVVRKLSQHAALSNRSIAFDSRGKHRKHAARTWHARSLVIIIGSIRGGHRTWESLDHNVLKPNGAHLALMVPLDQQRTRLHNLASYIWPTTEYAQWSVALDEISQQLGAKNRTAWRAGVRESKQLCCRQPHHEWCCMRPHFLGPLGWSATVNLVQRWHLKQRLLSDGLLARYSRFMITRSDQFYGCPLSFAALDEAHVWVPEGEDHGGLCDRVIICGHADVIQCLSIVDGFLLQPVSYNWEINPEKFFKERLVELQLWPRVRRFARTMFTAAHASDRSLWAAFSKLPDPLFGVHLKYEREYIRTKWSCGFCAAGSHTPFCCGHLGY